jgi:hypothetical protein
VRRPRSRRLVAQRRLTNEFRPAPRGRRARRTSDAESEAVRQAGDGYVDATVTTTAPGPSGGFGVRVDYHGQIRYRWGFGPVDHEFVVEDSAPASALRTSSRVQVTIDLEPDGAGQAMRGEFPARLTVWRLGK